MDPNDLMNALCLAYSREELKHAWKDITDNWGKLTPSMQTDAIRLMQSKYRGNAPDTAVDDIDFAYMTFKRTQRGLDHNGEITKAIVAVAKGVGKRDN